MTTLAPEANPQVQGEIGYHQLSNWWLQTFTEQERAHIEQAYQPFQIEPATCHPLTDLAVQDSSEAAGQFLFNLASWLAMPRDRALTYRILTKALELSEPGDDILQVHQHYQVLIKFYGEQQPLTGAMLEAALKTGEQMVAIAPQVAQALKQKQPEAPLPRHQGFEHLIRLRATQGDDRAVTRLCRLAKEQGWQGGWDKLIAKYRDSGLMDFFAPAENVPEPEVKTVVDPKTGFLVAVTDNLASNHLSARATEVSEPETEPDAIAPSDEAPSSDAPLPPSSESESDNTHD
ncbi:MAG: hypothetical protein AAFW84_03390 [Cyanobacteria bacterium J06635_15]